MKRRILNLALISALLIPGLASATRTEEELIQQAKPRIAALRSLAEANTFLEAEVKAKRIQSYITKGAGASFEIAVQFIQGGSFYYYSKG